jgi:hypothetical protein
MIRRRPDNAELADLLDRVSDLIEAEGGDPWRARAWRTAAGTIRGLDRLVVAILDEEGPAGLVKLPGIGRSISAAIEEYAASGRLGLLERLEGSLPAARLFTTVPGIGEDLARRIHETLRIETLEGLEAAAHDGRLARVPGFGPRRIRAVKDALGTVLRRSAERRARQREPEVLPPIDLLLEVDRAYRRGARDGTLKRIPPRRFNPEHKAWLPVLEVERDGWELTAMFSNSARAHALGATEDWVVVSWAHEGRTGLQTVVTERRGPQAGRRVVRGREEACARLYGRSSSPPGGSASGAGTAP